MKSNYEHMYDALRAADAHWHVGNEPEYLLQLAEWLTARGWVQIHREGTPEGEQQITTAANKISAAVEAPGALITTEVVSDVFVGLLNPNRHAEEGTG